MTVGGFPAVTLFWSDTQIQIQIPTGTGLGLKSVVIAVAGQPNTVSAFSVTPGLVGITPPATGLSASTALDLPNQVAPLTFNGTAGQLASVLGSNFNFGGFLSGADISILNPDGTTLVTTSMCGALFLGCNLFQNPVTLPTTGIYTLVIAQGIGSGTVTLSLFQNQTGTIISGVPVNTNINILGQEDLLTFSGTAGQLANVQLSNYNFTGIGFLPGVGISILNPDGTTLVTTWMCGPLNLGCWHSQGPVSLPTTGTYTLVIAPPTGGTGSGTVLLTLTYPNVNISASLSPVESWFSYPVAVNVTLTAKSGEVPTGSVTCSGAGVTSAQVTVNANGSATVPLNGLPLGKDTIVCSYASNNLVNFSNAVSSAMIETVTALPATGSVSVTPASTTLYGGQIQQFSASVFNTSNQAVTWSISPSGLGAISATGLYAAPASITSQQAVTVTATSQADTTQSASAMITLSPRNARRSDTATSAPSSSIIRKCPTRIRLTSHSCSTRPIPALPQLPMAVMFRVPAATTSSSALIRAASPSWIMNWSSMILFAAKLSHGCASQISLIPQILFSMSFTEIQTLPPRSRIQPGYGTATIRPSIIWQILEQVLLPTPRRTSIVGLSHQYRRLPVKSTGQPALTASPVICKFLRQILRPTRLLDQPQPNSRHHSESGSKQHLPE